MAKLNDVLNPFLAPLGVKSDLYVRPDTGDLGHRLMDEATDPEKYEDGHGFYLQRDQTRADDALKAEIFYNNRVELMDDGVYIVYTRWKSGRPLYRKPVKLAELWQLEHFPCIVGPYRFDIDTREWKVFVSTSGGPSEYVGTSKGGVYMAHAIVREWLTRGGDEPTLKLVK